MVTPLLLTFFKRRYFQGKGETQILELPTVLCGGRLLQENDSEMSEDTSNEEESSYFMVFSKNQDRKVLESEPTAKKLIEQGLDKNKNLNDEQTQRLKEMMMRNLDVFGTSYKDLMQTDPLELHINNGDAQLIKSRPNAWMPHSEREILMKESQNWWNMVYWNERAIKEHRMDSS